MPETLKIKDSAKLIDWIRDMNLSQARAIYDDLASQYHAYVNSRPRGEAAPDYVLNQLSKLFVVHGSWCGDDGKERCWRGNCADNAEALGLLLSASEQYDLPLRIAFLPQKREGGIVSFYAGKKERGFTLPYMPEYMEVIAAPAYDNITAAELRARLGTGREKGSTAIIPAEAEGLTANCLRERLNTQTGHIDDLKARIDDVKGAKTGELAEMQAQIEKLKADLETKKEAMLAELNAKKAEMERTKEKMEWQIYLLDSQIYDILCFAGETVQFTKLRSGKNAPDTEPVFVHQKLRFLDEDMARLASVYHISWDNIHMFEDLLKYSGEALELFAPDQRGITLVRLSRTGKILAERFQDAFGKTYYNVLDHFEYLHGTKVGILIRNGENLYLGWTDDDRIHINDDFIITSSQIVTETVPAPDRDLPSWEREDAIRREKEARRNIADGFISRSFVYSILQGVVEHSSILPLPAGTSLRKESEYVIYVVADKWLTDNRFDLPTIIEAVNSKVIKGDMLLTVQHLRPEPLKSLYGNWVSQSYHNDRGRGERNRTHDVSAKDCTLYPVNLVEYDEPVSMTRYKYAENGFGTIRTAELSRLSDDAQIVETYEETTRHVFISLEKTENWWGSGEKPARANFELYNSEFINLTFLDSVRLSWCINTKSLGGWKIAGEPVDYAYGIRYLKTALDAVLKRERHEAELLRAIDPHLTEDAEWPLKLARWRLEKNIHTLTEHSAGRYAKYIELNRKNRGA